MKKTANKIVKLAISQMPCVANTSDNIAYATEIVEKCAQDGAQLILLQELFAHQYFGPEQNPQWFEEAFSVGDSPVVKHFRKVAQEKKVFLPISFFERKNNSFFNSLAMIDDQGEIMGVYRKSHIPDGSGYQEKYYFSPGDSGFKVWDCNIGKIGTAICWDQWFPEVARAMALQGAEILLYPTAIGNEPQRPEVSSSAAWQRVMQGHAVANICFVGASNRIGQENWDNGISMQFYGKSFVAGCEGEILANMEQEQGYAIVDLDLEQARQKRAEWGLFRDRRPDLYKSLLTLSGER